MEQLTLDITPPDLTANFAPFAANDSKVFTITDTGLNTTTRPASVLVDKWNEVYGSL